MSAVVGQTPAWLAFLRHRQASMPILLVLAALLLLAALIASTIGAAGIPLSRLFAALGWHEGGSSMVSSDRLVLFSIRLPRIALAAMVGGLLAAGGGIMQGLFRNPLADPALVGVSSGAALAAAIVIVVGDKLLVAFMPVFPQQFLPIAAFVGALAMTLILYRIATWQGRTSIAVFLIGGLAIAALANAGIGLLVFMADDKQLRDITFWMLGSLSGATWIKCIAVLPFFIATLVSIPFIARGLDLLVLGEAEAFHMGISVERLKSVCILLVAGAVGAAVSVSGVIGFVGIVVPHLLRTLIGPGHRLLLPASILCGAILLVGADTAARTLAAPAELPIGILTALMGAPFFLVLLVRQRAVVG